MYQRLKPFLDCNNFKKSEETFLNTIHQMLSDLEKYKTSPKFKEHFFMDRLNIIDGVMNFHDATNIHIGILIEVIKKQALIIEAAKIEYPTINQPLGHIYDIYLQSQNRTSEIGTFKEDEIKVEIKII